MVVPARVTRRLVIAAAVLGAGCGIGDPIRDIFRSESPYEEYLAHLRGAGIDQLALGKDWIAAGTAALAKPVVARLPFRETGYFPPHAPGAVAYRLDLVRGRTLSIDVRFETAKPARLFVDLFEVVDTNPPRRVTSLAKEDSVLRYPVRRSGRYLLRLQPELLRGGRWTVIERTVASVGFPLPGFGVAAVKSRFGVERDAGRRQHHGIDIFAPRGTPAVAVVQGVAQVSTNPLGGNVVWLHDSREGRTFYYAHFDRWAIEGSVTVQPGDTLGFVGNTGNARTTPPHLHFGLYDGGPVDPYPFVSPDDPVPPAPSAVPERFDTWVRVTGSATALLAGADGAADTLRTLPRGSLAKVSGAAGDALRIELPDRTTGYLDAEAVTGARVAVGAARLPSGEVLRESPEEGAPAVAVLAAREEAEILGRFGGFAMVRLSDGTVGWRATAPSEQAAVFDPPPPRRVRRTGTRRG